MVLHWLNNKKAHLKQWVRNRVIEINRLADCNLWRYIDSKNNIADIGIRKGIKLQDVAERACAAVDKLFHNNELFRQRYIVTEGNTYKVSRTIKISCRKGLVVFLSKKDLANAWGSFYHKATLELKEFSSEKVYNKISVERGGILFYKGRILPNQEFGGRKQLSDVMIVLTSNSFCVPLVDDRSPFAYSVINEVHWYNEDALHAGVETVLRYTQKIAHILNGRKLVKKFRKMCIRCRILEKKVLGVCMGPVTQCNLNIAPAFYVTG